MEFPDDVPTLTEGDVTLRAHRPEDVEAAVEQSLDPVSIRWTTVPLDYDADKARHFVTEIMPNGWRAETEFGFAIECTQPDGRRRYSGTISLREEGDRRAEIAFGTHPAIRGRGVTTTAARLILDWGFADRDYETVLWWANRGNTGSRRVVWKSGFTFGGTVRRWLSHRGEYPDGWVASLHRDDDREPKTQWLDTPTLTGERVVLRGLVDADVPRIVEGCSDPQTRQFLPFLPVPYTDADAHEFLNSRVEGASLGLRATWGMTDPGSGRHLGNIGYPRIGREDAEIGYWTHPDARGRGLTREAVGLLVRHAFIDVEDGGLGLRRVFLKAAATNAASQRIALANGMRECGRERGAERLGDGEVVDLALFDLLRDEWLAARP